MVERLEKCIEEYDRILIWNICSVKIWDMFLEFCNSDVFDNCKEKILLAYVITIEHQDDSINTNSADENLEIRKLTGQEYSDILDLYLMYEFSDRVRIISGSSQYAGMMNYVDTGLLTQKELFMALLC